MTELENEESELGDEPDSFTFYLKEFTKPHIMDDDELLEHDCNDYI